MLGRRYRCPFTFRRKVKGQRVYVYRETLYETGKIFCKGCPELKRLDGEDCQRVDLSYDLYTGMGSAPKVCI
ncbi:unnamed protein product [marine sediment metagenome]|uniref:Uncharacterized protein n=1 Tax=marine sediment metagenome TaxID=412755 RepID=X1F8R6_9ZZZZ